jgi:hypothetical protein
LITGRQAESVRLRVIVQRCFRSGERRDGMHPAAMIARALQASNASSNSRLRADSKTMHGFSVQVLFPSVIVLACAERRSAADRVSNRYPQSPSDPVMGGPRYRVSLRLRHPKMAPETNNFGYRGPCRGGLPRILSRTGGKGSCRISGNGRSWPNAERCAGDSAGSQRRQSTSTMCSQRYRGPRPRR